MDLDRDTLARIDRKLLAGLGNDEAFRTLRVPATGAKWATWKRYCDAAGISMGRAVAALIDAELLSVFGESTTNDSPTLAEHASEKLAIRERELIARETQIAATEERVRLWSNRLHRREAELDGREQRVELISKVVRQTTVADGKVGRNQRCPCGSGLKYKRCHGSSGRAKVTSWMGRIRCFIRCIVEPSKGDAPTYPSDCGSRRVEDQIIDIEHPIGKPDDNRDRQLEYLDSQRNHDCRHEHLSKLTEPRVRDREEEAQRDKK